MAFMDLFSSWSAVSPKYCLLMVIEAFIILCVTDYGLPMMAFSLKFRTFGLGQKNWADKFWGICGILWPNTQYPFWYSESLVHLFYYSTNISTKTKPLYPHPKYLFQFGSQ